MVEERGVAAPRLALVGFMGVGKSTIGRALACRLGVDFADLDDEIARDNGGRRPASLFAAFGELGFRQRERETLVRVWCESGGPLVMACGGGTPCVEGAWPLLKAHGHTVALHLPMEALLARLGPPDGARPLWDGDREALMGRYQARLGCYAQADWTVDARPPVAVVVSGVIDLLSGVGLWEGYGTPR